MRFYYCEHCGNIIAYFHSSGVPVVCCGEKMRELVPNSVEGSVEKHLPVIALEGREVVVRVGSAAHPMLENHHIEWVVLETEGGWQKRTLPVGGEPVARFALAEGEKVVAAYGYCNIHGLWKSAWTNA